MLFPFLLYFLIRPDVYASTSHDKTPNVTEPLRICVYLCQGFNSLTEHGLEQMENMGYIYSKDSDAQPLTLSDGTVINSDNMTSEGIKVKEDWISGYDHDLRTFFTPWLIFLVHSFCDTAFSILSQTLYPARILPQVS